jgi:hypothetical protein
LQWAIVRLLGWRTEPVSPGMGQLTAIVLADRACVAAVADLHFCISKRRDMWNFFTKQSQTNMCSSGKGLHS